MPFHRASTEPEAVRDLLVAEAAGQECQYLELPLGQALAGPGLHGCMQNAGEAGFKHGGARRDRPHGLDELGPGGRLEEIARGAGGEGASDVLVVPVRAHQQHPYRRMVTEDLARRLDAGQTGQPDVHEDDIGLQGIHEVERPLARLRLADDLEVRLVCESVVRALPMKGMIVHHEDTDSTTLHVTTCYARVCRGGRRRPAKAAGCFPSRRMRAITLAAAPEPPRGYPTDGNARPRTVAGRSVGGVGVSTVERSATVSRIRGRDRRFGTGRVLLTALGIGVLAVGVLGCSGTAGGAPAGATEAAATGPTVHIATTILTGEMLHKSDWPEFLPADLTVPANSTVVLTIYNFDDGAAALAADSPYLKVSGTVGNQATANGTAIADVAADQVAHTFTVPSLGLNVPIPVAPAAGQPAVVTVTFHVGKPGTYGWQCMTPCGSGTDGMGGAMAAEGAMKGTITVTAA